MHWSEMVVAIVIVVTIGRVLQARYGGSLDPDRAPAPPRSDDGVRAENAQLRHELAGLKERMAVLERLATDTQDSVRLDREIERLRDQK